jgi:hypothetical protein
MDLIRNAQAGRAVVSFLTSGAPKSGHLPGLGIPLKRAASELSVRSIRGFETTVETT